MPAPQFEIEHYTADRVPNPNPRGETTFQLYHTVRNAMVKCCRRHGPVGPLGILPISFWGSYNVFKWKKGDPDPWYWIIDDQYNEELYLYAEILKKDALTLPWLHDVGKTLSKYPGWGMGINNIKNGYVLVFANKLMVHGEAFANCNSVDAVVSAAQSSMFL